MRYKNITVFTGAGISADSGLPTFREPNGLWDNHNPDIVSHSDGFELSREEFMNFWDTVKGEFVGNKFKPNKAHELIARWEYVQTSIGGKFNLITTNVDNLHDLAGSSDPIKIHGDILVDGREYEYEVEGQLFSWKMPDVVLFGDTVKRQKDMWDAVNKTDLFVCVGSSCSLGEGAIVRAAKDGGAVTVEINPNPTGNKNFDVVISKSATEGIHDLSTLVTGAKG